MRTRTLRSTLRSVLPAGLVASALSLAAGGCKWTDFDDLKEETWATSTGKPDNSAANWAVAVARVGRGGPGAGGTLAVLGANAALYDELTIGPGGDVNTTTEVPLDVNFAVDNLANEPLLLPRPDADEVALVTGVDASRSLAVRAVGGQLDPVSVGGPGQPTAAAYMVPPVMGGGAPQMQMLIAQAETVYGVIFNQATPPNPGPKCTLVDGAPTMAKINVRALGAYRLGTTATSDDVLALTDTGKLLAYPGTVFGGCTMTLPNPVMSADLTITSVQPGSQILVFSDAGTTYAVVQAHNDTGKGRLGLYRITASAIEEVGPPRDVAGLRTAALFQHTDGAKRYVLAGVPNATVEGVVAGQVQAFEIDPAMGISVSPAMSLSDTQPEDRQSFGRGVAALPFNGKTIIAVAADNDVFVYFRTTLYGETREGR
jgi:hypothetical protein